MSCGPRRFLGIFLVITLAAPSIMTKSLKPPHHNNRKKAGESPATGRLFPAKLGGGDSGAEGALADIRDVIAGVLREERQFIVNTVGFCAEDAVNATAPFQCVPRAPCRHFEGEQVFHVGSETFCQGACPDRSFETQWEAEMKVCWKVRSVD